MLVFTRKSGQKFLIGDDIVITILSMKSSQVLIGIDAPLEVPVHREEVYQRILSERATATEQAGGLVRLRGL